MSVLSDNFGIILSSTLGALGTLFGFLKGKKSRESNANIEIGKAYELMARQNNAFIITMTEKIEKQTTKIEHLEFEVIGLRNENKLLLTELKKYRKK